MTSESYSAHNPPEGLASSAQEKIVPAEWTVEKVADVFKENILNFTNAHKVEVSFGEDTDGHKTIDIRAMFEGEDARMISFHVTGPDAMSISDLHMLGESREQITALFGGAVRANEIEARGLGESSGHGYDDQDSKVV